MPRALLDIDIFGFTVNDNDNDNFIWLHKYFTNEILRSTSITLRQSQRTVGERYEQRS